MDAMICEHQLVQALKESGNRPAPRRLMILSAVRRADGRIPASEALRRVQRSHSFIAASAVCRTLDTLTRTRLASETRMGGFDAHARRPAPFGRRRDRQSAARETATADR